MTLLVRKTVILAKVEATYGTDATPSGAANAILAVIDPTRITPLAGSTVQRQNTRPYLGGYKEIHVGTHVMVQFSVEMAGAGAVDSAPKWGVLLEGCGFAETITPTTGPVDYDPVSDSFDSLTIYFHLDGSKHALLGARGTVVFKLNENQIPMMDFTFTGLWADPAAVADPTPDFTGWQIPLPVNNVNTPTATLDSYDCILNDLTVDIGNTVEHMDRPNEEAVKITDRAVKGSLQFGAPALGTKNFFTIATSDTPKVLNVIHGTAAGNVVTINAPAAQILQPKYGNFKGEATLNANLTIVPTDAGGGDDEIQISTQ